MAYVMACDIRFLANEHRDEVILNKVTEITFESSFKELVSKGSITLPRNIRLYNSLGKRIDTQGKAVYELFSVGDKVVIKWGYNKQLLTEFEGYVSKVSADIPVVIHLEDEMYKIKRMPVNFSSPHISLEELLHKIIPGYKIQSLPGVVLGSVRMPKTQVGAVLEKLQSDWGLYTYYKNGVIYCGEYYVTETDTAVAIFDLERNCVSTALNYKRAEDVKLKIKAVSTLPNGSKIEVDGIGDIDGLERQLTFYNVTDVKELEVLAKIEYERFKVDGFDGSFTAFGVPSVTHGMKCRLGSQLYKDREGLYYIDKVRKTFGINGIRQEISLGSKVKADE